MRTRTIIAGMTPLQLAEHVEVLLELSKVLGEEALVDEPQHISTLRTVVQNAIEVVCPTNNALRDVQELLMRELGLTSPPVRNGRAPSPSPSPSRQSSLGPAESPIPAEGGATSKKKCATHAPPAAAPCFVCARTMSAKSRTSWGDQNDLRLKGAAQLLSSFIDFKGQRWAPFVFRRSGPAEAAGPHGRLRRPLPPQHAVSRTSRRAEGRAGPLGRLVIEGPALWLDLVLSLMRAPHQQL
jgi:hypothetical protein